MKKIALVLGLLSGFLFGMATPLSKFLLSDLNAFQLAGLLYLGAAAAVFPWAVKDFGKMRALVFQRATRSKILGIVFFGGLAGPVLLMLALQTAHAASVSIWLNMELLATAVLGMWLFREYADRYTWIGVAFVLAAGIVMSWGEGTSGIIPALLVMGACFCWGMDNNLTAIVDEASPQTTTFIKGLVAGSVNLGIGMLISGGTPSLGGVALALGVGVFSYGLSIVLYIVSAQNLGSTRSQILFSTSTLWGVFLSFLVLGEPLGLAHWIALGLLATGIVLTNILAHEHPHTHEAIEHLHFHTHDDGHHSHAHEKEILPGRGHSHLHRHEPLTHSHKHYPDIHHRHDHEKDPH